MPFKKSVIKAMLELDSNYYKKSVANIHFRVISDKVTSSKTIEPGDKIGFSLFYLKVV